MSFGKTVDNKTILPWLSSKLPLNQERLEYIMSNYGGDLALAVEDRLGSLNHQTNKWLDKWSPDLLFDLESELEDFYAPLDKESIDFFTILDDVYPKQLMHIKQPPIVLYYQGSLECLDLVYDEMVTVVGARNISRYGEMLMDKVLRPLCQSGVGVVSGLAYGVDRYSHEVALDGGAVTIGVCGSSLDGKSFYPASNKPIKKKIIETGGLVMSEYAYGQQGTRYTFPRRNEILAALTKMTWVVQAALKSGSLITANAARDMGREVASSPASIFSDSHMGSIALIKDGAQVVTDAQDVLSVMGINAALTESSNRAKEIDDPVQSQVYDNLSLKPKSVESLIKDSGVDMASVTTALTMLELSGLAVNLGDNMWQKAV